MRIRQRPPLARAEPVARDDALIEVRIATIEPCAEPRDLGNPRLQTRGGASFRRRGRFTARPARPDPSFRNPAAEVRRIGIGRTVRQQTRDDVSIVRHRQEGWIGLRL